MLFFIKSVKIVLFTHQIFSSHARKFCLVPNDIFLHIIFGSIAVSFSFVCSFAFQYIYSQQDDSELIGFWGIIIPLKLKIIL